MTFPMTPRIAWRVAALGVLLAIVASALFAGRLQGKMRDFEVYWTAGARAAAAEPLYRAEDGHYRFKYLPGFAVAISPFARLPLGTAKVAWFLLSVVCLVALVALAVALVPDPAWRPGVLATFTVVAMAKFFGHELVLGQVNVVFGLLCILGLTALVRRHDGLAGICFGAATLIKPYAIVFLLYLLLVRRWRAAAASTAALAIVLALPVPVFGMQGTTQLMLDWWRTASETSAPLLTNADATSVFAMYAKWIGWGPAAAALSLVTLAALAAGFLTALAGRARVPAAEVLEVALLMTLIPLATPQGWDYALLLSMPLVALLIGRAPAMPAADRGVTVAALALVAFSLYDVMGRAAYRTFMALSIVTVCYLALIVVALRLRLRGAA